ncbi:MAG: hypothetical protein QMC89_00855 [Candidatus Hodarchaeaceae archaeon]|nr:hypothetical protein [Candidatus Hodarchaeaceae archaeon]
MDQLSVGEDLFATLIVASLAVLFVAALVHSYHVYAERKNAQEGLSLALDIANQLKNEVLAKHENYVCPGLINLKTFDKELSRYHQLLFKQGIKLRVEVRKLDGELALAYGAKASQLGRYFSPPCSVSLPVTIAETPASRSLGELIVWVWR